MLAASLSSAVTPTCAADAGLVVVSIDDPKNPQGDGSCRRAQVNKPHAVQVQFRYGFVCDDEGVVVLDVTDLAHPDP